MDWDKFENALNMVREDAKAETDKLFAEFSAKHDVRISELHRAMEKSDKMMSDIADQNQRNRQLKSEIEDLLASMRG